jgi:hypothetical protein
MTTSVTSPRFGDSKSFSFVSFAISRCGLSYNMQFKKGDIFFNYGCFPQTWEDPTYVHPDAEGCRGDNDPLDVCEIGARIIRPGVRFPYRASEAFKMTRASSF